jgi:hypothetical protein
MSENAGVCCNAGPVSALQSLGEGYTSLLHNDGCPTANGEG